MLNREFSADQPNTKWVTDTKAVETAEGWLYLAVILDLFSRQVVGWSMAATEDGKLVECALRMALVRRHPEAGLLRHSYAWNLPKTLLDETLNEDHPPLEGAERAGDAALEPDG